MATKKTAKKSSAKKTATKKAPTKKAAVKKAPAKKTPVKKTTAKKSSVKKAESIAVSSGGVPLTGKIARNRYFKVKVLRDQLDRLLLLRERISGEISSISRDSLSPTERDPSTSDQGTDTFDREFALKQLSSEQDVLFEIDAAIRRLEDGTYGICEISNEPINIERLQALPYVRYTIATQSDLEKGHNSHRPFGSILRG